MKKHVFILFISFSLFVSVFAQTSKNAAPKPDLTEQSLRKHVTYLASDKLEGRRTGEKGATWAAGYVANMFSNYKLKGGSSEVVQGKTKTSFLQPFPFAAGVGMPKEGNEFRFEVANSTGQTLPSTNAAAWLPVGFSPNGEMAETPIVFAGYGVSSADLKYDDYVNLNVEGKIVLVFDGTPEIGNPHSQFARFDARAKAKIAKDKGAKALFLIAREAKVENNKLTAQKFEATLGEAAMPTLVVSRETAYAMLGTDEAGLRRTEDFFQLRNESEMRRIQSEFSTRPQARAAFKINLVKKQIEGYNVIGILEGNDPVLKNEAIVIGAHYDHLGRGGEGSLAANSTAIHHGADDNASGVAGMLELARQFSAEKKNKRTIIFMAFGGEEEGLLGSKFYVNNPVFPLAKTVAMINIDMVGRLKDNKLTVGGIGTASDWKSLVNKINGVRPQALQLPLPPKSIGGEPLVNVASVTASAPFTNFNLQLNEDGFGPSDHSSFYGKQIPVLFFFTGTHMEYHKPTDTSDRINYEGLKQITSYISEIVKNVDQNPNRPAYAQAKSSGATGGRTTFNVSLGTIPSYSDSNDGLVLDGVRDNSPASKASLKGGDKIIKLAGREIRNISDYTFVLGEMKANQEYEVIVKRGNETLTLKIVPAPRP